MDERALRDMSARSGARAPVQGLARAHENHTDNVTTKATIIVWSCHAWTLLRETCALLISGCGAIRRFAFFPGERLGQEPLLVRIASVVAAYCSWLSQANGRASARPNLNFILRHSPRIFQFRCDDNVTSQGHHLGVRFGAMACEGTRMFRYAGQDGSHQLCYVQQSADHGRARALGWTSARSRSGWTLWGDGLRGHKDVSLCRAGWFASTVLCAAKF